MGRLNQTGFRRAIMSVGLGLTLSVSVSGRALAQASPDQPTRSEQLAQIRDEKAQELAPPKPSIVERALQWYDDRNGRLDWRGFHFGAGGFTGGAGLGYGIGYRQRAIGAAFAEPELTNRMDVELIAARSTLGYKRLSARFDFLNVGGAPVDFTARAQKYDFPREDFYGFGYDSSVDNRTSYRTEGSEIAAGLTWRPLTKVRIGGGVAWLAPTMGSGMDPLYPSTEDVFDPATVPGLETLPEFLRADMAIAYDWRDNATHPRRGGQYSMMVSRFDDRAQGDFNFNRIDLEAQQIVPLGNRYRRIELRAAALLTDAATGSEVPLIYQPSLGGPRMLRGFSQSRFRDRQAVAMAAEYQWETWWALDAAVFVEAGQVMSRLRDLDFNRFETSYGLGLRLHTNTSFMARFDLAFSREGFIPVLGFKYGF